MDIIMVLAMPMAATNSETAPMPPRTACIMLDCCFVLSIQSAWLLTWNPMSAICF